MTDMANNRPVTKSELDAALGLVKSELKSEIQSVKSEMQSELKSEIQSVKAELRSKIQDVKTELKGDFKRLSFENVQIQSRLDRVEEKMATKDDISRVLNAIDKFAQEAESYRNQDVLRGHAIMEHDGMLKIHEKRIKILETHKHLP